MLRTNATVVTTSVLLSDLALLIAAFFSAWAVQSRLGAPHPLTPYDQAVLLASLPLWLLGLAYSGAYESMRQKPWYAVVGTIARVAFVVGVLLASCLYLVPMRGTPRFIPMSYSFFGALYITVFRLFGLSVVRQLRHIGFNRRYVLIVGTDKAATRYGKLVQERLDWGLRLVGFLSDDAAVGEELLNVPVVGRINELRRILVERPVDRVIFSVPPEKLAAHLAVCEQLGIEAVFIPRFDELQVAKIHVENFFGLPVINYTMTPQQMGQLILKRLMDFTLSSIAVLLLLPLFAAIAVAIKLDSKGPVFFKQRRVTLYGRTFVCLKFRTMFTDAEARLAELRDQNEMSGPVFKMKNDPRITRVGRVLRKFSLDELPQLINVVISDMSLVGPRPPLPGEVQAYEPWHRRRLSMKPGITCLWQVSGRNNIDFDAWMKLDLDYIDHWSLGLDVKLLLKTIPAVVRGTGM
jgi:exopolysaccharide biosynthesis polyprenyl glycosylphosphotransferase